MAFLKKVGRTERRHTKATRYTLKTNWMWLHNALHWLGWKRIGYALFNTPRPGVIRFDKDGKPLDVTHIHSKRMATVNPKQKTA